MSKSNVVPFRHDAHTGSPVGDGSPIGVTLTRRGRIVVRIFGTILFVAAWIIASGIYPSDPAFW